MVILAGRVMMEQLDYLIEPLTEQETAVLRLLAEQCSNQEIAERLVLAPSTVKWYVRQLNSKLDARNRKQIVERALSLGLVGQEDAPRHAPHNLRTATTPFIGREHDLRDLRVLLADETARLITIHGPGGMGKTRLALEVARAQHQAARFRDGVYVVDLAPVSTRADAYDRAIADMMTMLRNGQPLQTCIAQAAASIPEPGASSLRRFLQDLEAGVPLEQAIERAQEQTVLIGFDGLFALLRTQADHPDTLATRLQALRQTHHPDAGWHEYGDLRQYTAHLISSTIINTLAQAMGHRDVAWMPRTLEQLGTFFAHRHMLLVLDNFEHLLQGAVVLSDLLAHAPGLHILVTSREKLNLAGETVYLLDGLDVVHWETMDAAQDAASVRLFVQAAQRTNPHFAVLPESLAALIRIGTLTEGMPLGLLLAASWADVLTLDEIADEIQRSVDFLQTEQQDVADRHRSMRALFTSTWQRLPAEAQAVFARLSVFRNGCTREAARIVTGADIHTIKRLVNSSLISIQADGRYRMHELLRQYAAECLDHTADVRDEAYARHAAYFLDLARAANHGLTTSDQQRWFQRLSSEHDNLQAAWTWYATRHDVEMMAAMCLALYRFWALRASYRFWALCANWQEGLFWIAQMIDSPDLSERLRAEVRSARSALLLRQGDMALAREDALVALSYAQTIDDMAGLAQAQLMLANIENEAGNNQQAASYLEQCLPLFRAMHDDYHIVTALNILACIRMDMGQPDESWELFRASADHARACGLTIERAEALVNSGIVAALRGDVAGAAACREGLHLIAALREHHGMPFILTGLAAEAGLYGDHHRAGILAGAATAWCKARNQILLSVNAPYFERMLQQARGPLDEAAWSVATEQGADLPFEQIVALALQPPHPQPALSGIVT